MSSSLSKLPPRWKLVWSVPPISSSIPCRVHKGANGLPMPPRCRRHKKTLELMARLPQRCGSQATKLTPQAQPLHQERTKVLRGCGRQCRGQGHVFVKLVRHTEHQLLELGKPITALGHQAQQLLAQATALSDSTRQRLADAFSTAMSSHAHIRKQSTQLTQGK